MGSFATSFKICFSTLICLIAEHARITIFKLFTYPARLLATTYLSTKKSEQGELCYLVPARLIRPAQLLGRQEYADET